MCAYRISMPAIKPQLHKEIENDPEARMKCKKIIEMEAQESPYQM